MYLNRFADTTDKLDMAGRRNSACCWPAPPTSAFRTRRRCHTGRATSCCGSCGSTSWNGARRTRRRSCCCMAGTSRRIPGTWSACTWRSDFRVLALDQRGHGDSEWVRDVAYSNHEMSLDAEAFIAALGLRAADSDRPLDGRAQRDAADPARSGAAARRWWWWMSGRRCRIAGGR